MLCSLYGSRLIIIDTLQRESKRSTYIVQIVVFISLILGGWLAIYVDQRRLIYTEHKPLGRLYKMCDPFFREFQVIPSANGFQFVCYTEAGVLKKLSLAGLVQLSRLLIFNGVNFPVLA